jgi:hypothetical protein
MTKDSTNLRSVGELEERIQARLAPVDDRRRHAVELTCQQQATLDSAWQRFSDLADRLLRQLIRPSMARLATHFDNADLVPPVETGGRRCVYVFRCTRRCRATVRVELAVHADANVQNLILLRRVELFPPILPLREQERLTFPLDEFDEQAAGAWIEAKLLDIVDLLVALDAEAQGSLPSVAGRIRAAA